MDETEDGFRNLVLWDDPGITVCAASALAAYWSKDYRSFSGWLDNIARRLWLPGYWNSNINRASLLGGFREWMMILTDILTAASYAEDISRPESKLYKEAVMRFAEKARDFDTKVQEQTYIANDVSNGTEMLASHAAHAMRFYCLAHYHQDVNSPRNHKYDWDDFKEKSSVVVSKTIKDTDQSNIDTRKRVQECIRVLRKASMGKEV